MRGFNFVIFAAVAACSVVSASGESVCSRAAASVSRLKEVLSDETLIYLPGTPEFIAASTRWSVLDAPTPNIVVVPASESDVVSTVKFANHLGIPILAFNGAHGSLTTLGKFDCGIEIYLSKLSSVNVSEDGQTATIGGGTLAINVTNELWDAGKQTVTGTCECVSLLGPALGGGHGWLQGHHGLVADQFVSMNIVLANGSLITVDETSDLWWAVKGAGHNFGLVTSLTVKIYDIEHTDWAIETIIFSGDEVEAIYDAANEYILKNGTQDAGLINWSYWLNIPAIDPEKPIILFYIIQEGVAVIDSSITQPFHDLNPLSVTAESGTYQNLAAWTQISLGDAPCQKSGLVNPRFPLYLQTYNLTAQKEAYQVFTSNVNGSSPFNSSIYMFEDYSSQGVKAIDSDSSAFAFRDANILSAPLLTYVPTDATRDQQAATLGNQLRDILHAGSDEQDYRVYVNYAYGDESPAEWYGSEGWRQQRLQSLKKKYDPKGVFSFYAPII
ncbi:FAD binding domain protein [Truncatella angustata]|uniref:FAD binding domain protein n=1 Tax=Truncatella angustata TaxID=152316 RepID=A0A9P9A2W1_9PEZI|nr:FAD binding domain protein [Truncatella angustata]KAH6658340.1 FAD binding domain protein [Truncatella angustata]